METIKKWRYDILTYKIIWSLSQCSNNCNDCIDACPSKVLKKNNDGLLIMKPYSDCGRCESCYMVCNEGALNIQWLNDTNYNLSMIEYIN